MIECSKCGSENHFDGAAFCRQCGAQLSARVAVEVAAESKQLNDTEKIRVKDIQARAAAPAENEEFTVEDISDPAEVNAEAQKLRPTAPEGGIDKLLSLYGNDGPIEQAGASMDETGVETASLGIESASDYLLRDQLDSQPAPAETQAPAAQVDLAKTQDKLSEIQSKLTPIEDKEPEFKNPMGVPKQRTSQTAVPTEEKDRLLSNLSRSLHSETRVRENGADTPAERQESHQVIQEADLESTEDMADDSVQDPMASHVMPSADPEPVIPAIPMVQVTGKKLTFPDSVRLLPGDQITVNDQKYTLQRGTIDKRSWILGGTLLVVLLVIMIVQSLTAPAPIKAKVFGVVTNSETNEVLAGISVSIPQLNLTTVTDEHGVFEFPSVANGRYDVKLEGGLYEARFFPIVIQDNQSDIVYGSMTPILPQSSTLTNPVRPTQVEATPAETQSDYGTLKVNSNVADAQVFVDGKSLGKVSQIFKRMRPGNRSIVIKAEGYQDVTQTVNVIAGETTELTANLLSVQSEAPVEYTADDFFDQAEALFNEQKYIEAVGYYTLALAKNGTMVKAYLRRAEAHLQAGKKLNARADYRSAADLYINSAMYAQAIACYDKIIEFQPNASDAFSLRGWAKIAAGDYDNGVGDLQKALAITPDDPQALFDVGKAYYVTNRYKDAEKILKKIRKHGDENPEIHGYLALTQLAQGDESDARKSYDAFRKVASSAQIARMSTESGWQRLTALAGN